MITQAVAQDGQRQPDILEVLSDLSNDQVFTPPKVANAVLDLLPRGVWKDPDLRWLDPGCKTGVFPREIVKRLMVGLTDRFADRQERLAHILRNMVFGIATEELTALISRRTLYCSKDASGPKSVVGMAEATGNIWFERTEHRYDSRGRCQECGARQSEWERPDGDNHAYAFIHEQGRARLSEEIDMQFDVIVGNPPYQMSDGGHNASATTIYHYFVEQAIDLGARYVLMITPSRWFSGGKGLDDFRTRMLEGHHLRELVDYPKLYEPFPTVKIRGGISYFLWDRDHDGPCSVQTMWEGAPIGEPKARYLDAYDVLIRRNEDVSILDKVTGFRVDGKPEETLEERVSAAKPFGFRTFHHGAASPERLEDPIKFFGSQKVTWIERADVEKNIAWVDKWKVLMTRVQGTSAAVETKFLSEPIVSGPGEACSETYLVAGTFESKDEADRYAAYLRTRFVRFLVSLKKTTQDAPRRVYGFVPDLPMDRIWTDDLLYQRYGINDDERSRIEDKVAEMSA